MLVEFDYLTLPAENCLRGGDRIIGVARGPGARGQGILTAPGEIFEIFFFRHKKIVSYPSKFLMTFFLVITQFFVINHYNTRVLRPSLPN